MKGYFWLMAIALKLDFVNFRNMWLSVTLHTPNYKQEQDIPRWAWWLPIILVVFGLARMPFFENERW